MSESIEGRDCNMGGLLHNGVKGWLITILAVLCLVVTCGMCGKAKESGGEPLPILRFGTTARIWGMGNAGVAAARGVEGLYYNPAALSDLSRPELSISHSALFSDTDLNFIAAALPITEQGALVPDSCYCLARGSPVLVRMHWKTISITYRRWPM